jgi:hypothetical protein
MSWEKIESFCLDAEERFIYAGTISGEILSIELESFSIKKRFQAQSGSISIIAKHPKLPYLSTRSGGWVVTLWKQGIGCDLKKLIEIDVLNIRPQKIACSKKPLEFSDQALAFHPIKPLLATRTGEDGLLELEFNEHSYKVSSYSSVHEVHHISNLRYVVNTNKILCGTVHGHVFLLEEGKIIQSWKIADEDIHWFEHCYDDIYLIANDSRRLFRLDLASSDALFSGNKFARDDFEHVIFDPTTNRAFASSFDRNIYQVDPVTCEMIKVIWTAPYKCRWIAFLKKNPDILIVLCRNGGLYKISIDTSEVVSEIKLTPNAIWTACQIDSGKIIASGEGNYLQEFIPNRISNIYNRITTFDRKCISFNSNSEFFFKRSIFDNINGCLWLGSTDGSIVAFKKGKFSRVISLPSAVRDLTVDSKSLFLYVVCEGGELFKVSLQSLSIVEQWRSNFPLWALALNEEVGVIAVSERMGDLVLLDIYHLQPISREVNHRYSKRMKWIDSNTLLYGSEGAILKYDISKLAAFEFIKETGNSVEDFVWDKHNKYLALINYNRKVMLFQLSTGQLLDSVHDQFDFSYGILWLNEHSSFPNEFVTFGRIGTLCHYQVYENCLLRNGCLDSSNEH